MKRILYMVLFFSIFCLIACQNDNYSYYNFKNKTYVNDINENIKFDIPQIDNEGFSFINDLINNTIVDYILDEYGYDLSNLTLDLSYEISCNSKDLISIKFFGIGNIATAAHPNHLFKTVNIDVTNKKIVKLNEIYNIDDEFINIYINEFKNNFPEIGNQIMKNYSKKNLLEYFNNSDEKYSSIMTYYTKDKIGISLSVPHALGDHIEIEVDQKLISKSYPQEKYN